LPLDDLDERVRSDALVDPVVDLSEQIDAARRGAPSTLLTPVPAWLAPGVT
jgi:hypothetical protein